jgi:hypothetical protein
LVWTESDDGLQPLAFSNLLTGEEADLRGADLFQVVLDHAPAPEPLVLRAGDMVCSRMLHTEYLASEPASVRVAPRAVGVSLSAEFADTVHGLQVIWRAELRDDANTVRVSVQIQPTRWAAVSAVRLIEGSGDGLRPCGTAEGAPLAGVSLFCGVEHPRSRNAVAAAAGAGQGARFSCSLPCIGLVRQERPACVSAVLGVAPAGQMRRAFLYYLERERPRPYTPYLHYNNGYEVGCTYWKKTAAGMVGDATFRPQEEAVFSRGIERLGTELVTKRGVALDGVAHDFMWDDENQVWRFHEGYPDGFGPVAACAAKYGANLGVWFGPWGGYWCRKARVTGGRQQGFLITPNGLTLTCPNYRARLLSAAAGMVTEYGAGYFKFDGFGLGNTCGRAGEYASEADALLEVIAEFRVLKPDLVINTSTGSWPSPFWLLHADVIWRQGSDSGAVSVGSPRQRWITFRDAETYRHIVKDSPLFPLSSLMLHGILLNFGRFAGDPHDPAGSPQNYDLPDVAAEVRTFFGGGTLLQELYVDPGVMNDALWDVLADAAKWARANAEVLADTHWLGGDPAALQVYGWASWRPGKGVVTLRNPADQPQSFALNLATALELPAGAPERYTLRDVWNTRPDLAGKTLAAVEPLSLDLAPFEVVVLEASPVTRDRAAGDRRAGAVSGRFRSEHKDTSVAHDDILATCAVGMCRGTQPPVGV